MSTPVASPEDTPAVLRLAWRGGRPAMRIRQAFAPRRWAVALLRSPDLLLVLALSAALRLPALGGTTFLDDQEELLALARSALVHHALPVTGIRSSVGALSFPASIYLLLPFAALENPFWAALFTALANVVATGLLFQLTARYAGRRAALVAGLLYATAAFPVYFSRFTWQQNLLAPLVILFFWSACRGTIEHKRGWLPWNLLLWGIATQLHASAAPLLAVTAYALALGWRQVRWRDLLISGVVLVALWLPTLMWEVVSQGSDVTFYRAYSDAATVIDGDMLRALATVLVPFDTHTFGAATPYARAYAFFSWTRPVVIALYAASVVWLVVALRNRAVAWRARRGSWATGSVPARFLLL
ncbi:MAG: ArnT family glycosyltransferase, partial [Ktedonobacterales bacterium]